MPLICFASPKGGVGKTTLAANIADTLRRNGRRVLALPKRRPQLLGAVCRDEAVTEALASQRMVLDLAPDSRAAEDLQEIVRGIEAALPLVPEAFPATWGAR
jgi:MinD-like ATPase involved in chromosome partitioning or flagellar assembly